MSRERSKSATESCPKGESGPLKTFAEVVEDYIRTRRQRVKKWRKFYQESTWGRALKYAALCMETESDKRHPHQRRIRGEALEESHRLLQACADQLRKSTTFVELHDLVEGKLGGVSGIGPLTVYDIANRLGAHLGVEPEDVYLHSGAAKGARAMGFDTAIELLPAAFPVAFKKLRPHEIEDCLCIYKDCLGMISQQRGNS